MMFAAAFVFVFGVWLLPWWSVLIFAGVIGFLDRKGWRRAASCALSAGLIYFAAAFIQDGRASGLISKRLDILFHAPSPYVLYGVTAAIAFVSAFLAYQCGSSLAKVFGSAGK